jgi:hypothetical protein
MQLAPQRMWLQAVLALPKLTALALPLSTRMTAAVLRNLIFSTRLQCLDCSRAPGSGLSDDAMAHLGACASLTELRVKACSAISDRAFPILAALPALMLLDMTFCD